LIVICQFFGRPFLYDWCFPDRIPNVTLWRFDAFAHDNSKNSKVTGKE
jgi:hypothetical protein